MKNKKLDLQLETRYDEKTSTFSTTTKNHRNCCGTGRTEEESIEFFLCSYQNMLKYEHKEEEKIF